MRARFAAAAVIFAASVVFGQVKESVTVSVVEVPVTVVDRGGNPIKGLTRENFEIIDEGKKREIGGNFIYLAAALVGVLLVSYTGHIGGEMVHPDRSKVQQGQFPGAPGGSGQGQRQQGGLPSRWVTGRGRQRSRRRGGARRLLEHE